MYLGGGGGDKNPTARPPSPGTPLRYAHNYVVLLNINFAASKADRLRVRYASTCEIGIFQYLKVCVHIDITTQQQSRLWRKSSTTTYAHTHYDYTEDIIVRRRRPRAASTVISTSAPEYILTFSRTLFLLSLCHFFSPPFLSRFSRRTHARAFPAPRPPSVNVGKGRLFRPCVAHTRRVHSIIVAESRKPPALPPATPFFLRATLRDLFSSSRDLCAPTAAAAAALAPRPHTLWMGF